MVPRVKLRRAAIALGLSTAMVVLIAAFLPRMYLANDDAGFTLYLRVGVFAPWSSSVLSWALVALYGLYLYAVIVATGAVLFHSCFELIDRRPGFARVATWIGASMLAASQIILAI